MNRFLLSAVLVFPAALLAQAPVPETEAPQDPVIATVLGQEIRESQKQRMSGIIFGMLMARYARENDLAATPAEVATFVAHTEKRDAQDRKTWTAEQKRLRARLKEGVPDAALREDMESQLETLDALLNVDPGIVNYERENPGEVLDMEAAIAREFIRTWKVMKSLHDKYGGRVVLQHSGPEPIDAYRAFLKDQERAGSFKFFAEDCKALFWSQYTNFDNHAAAVSNRADGASLLSQPWWLADEPKP